MKKTSPLAASKLDKIVMYMFEYYVDNKYYPNIREIGESSGVSTSTSVTNWYLDKLEGLGFVVRERKIARGTLLTDEGKRVARRLLGLAPVEVSAHHCHECGAPVDEYGSYRNPNPKPPTQKVRHLRALLIDG